jgi:uncharacterized membrane protein
MNRDPRPKVSGRLIDPERAAQGRVQPGPSLAEEVLAKRKIASSPTNTVKQLSPSEFNTAIVHFYRGEVQRSNTWRNRLDTTTNWAVLTAGATLSFAFSSSGNPHFVILINSLLVLFFLLMEARRYRYYELWSNRVRVIETGYFARMLSPDGGIDTSDRQWAEMLSNDLLAPHFTISEWEAIGRRLRRNYLWLFSLLALSWNLKVYLHPTPAQNFQIFIDRATIGVMPGALVFSVGVLFNMVIFVFALATLRLREATGEVLPEHNFAFRPFSSIRQAARTKRTTVRRAKRARQRVRTTSTGEYKKIDLSEIPNKIDISEMPNR